MPVWWLVGGVVAVTVVGIGVAVVAVKQLIAVSGARTPESAVVGLVQAVNDRDLLRAAALLPADELEQIDETLTSDGDTLVRTEVVDGGFAGGDRASVLGGLNVTVRGLQVSSELIEPDLAQVTLVGGTLTASVDPSATSGLLRTALVSSDIGSTGGTFSLDVADVNATLDRLLMVAAVQRDGNWYDNPTYTAGEDLLRRTGAIRAPAHQGVAPRCPASPRPASWAASSRPRARRSPRSPSPEPIG